MGPTSGVQLLTRGAAPLRAGGGRSPPRSRAYAGRLPKAQPRLQVEHVFAQRVVRPLRRGPSGIGVEARPRLAHRVDVKGAVLVAQQGGVPGGDVQRHVNDEGRVLSLQEGRQHVPIVLGREPEFRESRPAHDGDLPVTRVGVDDGDAGAVAGDVPEHDGQQARPDRAEADHHDGSGPARVNAGVVHGVTRKREMGQQEEWRACG